MISKHNIITLAIISAITIVLIFINNINDTFLEFHSESVDVVEYHKSSLKVYDNENKYIVIDVDTFMKYPDLRHALEMYEMDFGYNVDITDVVNKENNIKVN